MQAIIEIENKEELRKLLDFMNAINKPVTFVKSNLKPEAFADKIGELFVTADVATVKDVVERRSWIA